MDQGDGRFAPVSGALAETLNSLAERRQLADKLESPWPRLFVLGSEIEIRKSRFRVDYIGTDVLLLKLLPDDAAR